MFQSTLERLEACFTGDLPAPNSAQARTLIVALWQTAERDQAPLIEYATNRLRWLGHEAPTAWLMEATVSALARALARPKLDREAIVGVLTLTARLLTLNDPIGRVWKITRAGERGAVLQAQAHVQQGTYTLAFAPNTQRLNYRAPSLRLWWRAPGAAWLYEAPGQPPKNGKLISSMAGSTAKQLARALTHTAPARYQPAQHAA